MSGIIVATIITVALSVGIYGGVLVWNSPRQEWRLLLLAFLLEVPMSLVTFHWIRQPMDEQLKALVGTSEVYQWLRVLYAPITEEPAKLWPLLIPWFARKAAKSNAVRVAIALGLGFGVSEILLVAQLVSGDPKIAGLSWYQLGGFINERFMVCLMHGVFTATALCWWRRWSGGLWVGVAAAMALHLLGNLPIFLGALGVFGPNQTLVSSALAAWVTIYWLLMLTMLVWLATGSFRVGQFIFGDATCPTCGVVYPRPFLAINLGAKRLERCASCRKWHKV